jgi:hypothetical protein
MQASDRLLRTSFAYVVTAKRVLYFLTDIARSSILTDDRLWGAADGSVRVRCASVSI